MASPYLSTNITSSNDDEHVFDAVVDRLKTENALSHDCFLKEVPFFNIPPLSKEAQIKELFEKSCDTKLCRALLMNILPAAEGAECKFMPQNFSSVSVMSFAQIILFKVLPCPDGTECSKFPREIATHNQYRDFEYQCPFYHHDKDRRRLVIFGNSDEEFAYKANYFEEGKRRGEKEKHSQNYFESMFHPLYYKMFRCKRDYCDHSPFCPFFHNEEEKRVWDNTFSNYIRKDRVSYVKDRQKPAEKKPRVQDTQRRGSQEEVVKRDRQSNKAPRHQTINHGSRLSPTSVVYGPTIETGKLSMHENNWNFNGKVGRKDSEDSSFEEKYGRGFFSKLQGKLEYQIY